MKAWKSQPRLQIAAPSGAIASFGPYAPGRDGGTIHRSTQETFFCTESVRLVLRVPRGNNCNGARAPQDTDPNDKNCTGGYLAASFLMLHRLLPKTPPTFTLRARTLFGPFFPGAGA